MGDPIIEADVGLGTAYERLAVYALLDRWFAGVGLRSALEGPVDGMAGMPGLHLIGLARQGVNVTVALPHMRALGIVRRTYRLLGIEERLTTLCAADPGEIPGRFDLVLTYNALPLVVQWRSYLTRLAALVARTLLVSVTNPSSYGVMLRRLQRTLEPRRTPELFDHPSTRNSELRPTLDRLGTVEDSAFVDCPWWPDLFVPTGQTLWQGTIGRLPGLGALVRNRSATSARPGRFTYTPEHFPLFPGQPGHEDLTKALARHPVFDQRGAWLGAAFGHHRAHRIRVSAAPAADAVGVGTRWT
jgi:hypothetical protein